MFPRPRLISLALVSLAVLTPAVSHSQASALNLWEQMVDHPDFSEAELLKLAQYTRAEMSLFDFHLDICQQEQPESEEDFAEVKARFDALGAPILEFLGRYSDEELSALGVPNDQRFQESVDQQQALLASEFPALDDEWQKNTCGDLRATVRQMAPRSSVTRF